jgi:hypothetical protein
MAASWPMMVSRNPISGLFTPMSLMLDERAIEIQ